MMYAKGPPFPQSLLCVLFRSIRDYEAFKRYIKVQDVAEPPNTLTRRLRLHFGWLMVNERLD